MATSSVSSVSTSRPGRPLPLKQRTSSVDQRRDFNTQTWTSLLGLLKVREFVVTVDHFSLWRRHLAWAMENGKDLRDYLTARYASSMVFMSLLLSAELNVLFNSSGVTTQMRHALRAEEAHTVSFWAGIVIILSAVLTILSLISTFTAWTMVSSVSEVNAHCIFRSSIGQYVAELPGRFIVASIYSFIGWLILFFFLLLPPGLYSGFLFAVTVALFVHTITAFSAFGRVIMHTGAMGSQRIFDPVFEMTLPPHSLHQGLLNKAKAQLSNSTSIIRQYRHVHEPLDRHYSEEELCNHLATPKSAPVRKRTNSLVKFADGFDVNGDRFAKGVGKDKRVSTKEHNTPPVMPSAMRHAPPRSPKVSLAKGLHPPRPTMGRKQSIDFPQTHSNSNEIISTSDRYHAEVKRATPTSGRNDESFLNQWLSASIPDKPANNEKRSELPPISPPRQTTNHHDHHSLEYPETNTNDNEHTLSTPLPPLPSEIYPVQSIVSSLADAHHDDEPLTEEERFERDYGPLFDPEHDYSGSSSVEHDYSGDTDDQWQIDDMNEEYDAEQARLLPPDRSQHDKRRNSYASFDPHQS